MLEPKHPHELSKSKRHGM